MPKGQRNKASKTVNFAEQELPRNRTGKLLAWLDRRSIWSIAGIGIGLYIGVVAFVSVIEFVAYKVGSPWVFKDTGPASEFFDILYFNLITILTVGYGDYHPASFGKWLSVTEAFIGVGLFSLLVAVVTVKALLPPRNTIVVSKYAYYCTEPQCFLIIFVNTSNINLAMADISSYFKLGGDWGVKHSITAPFITRSVQTFHIDRMPLQNLISGLRDGDCLRVGIRGGIGFTSFSTSMQYSSDRILVIPNRNELVAYFEPMWEPDFNCPEFKRMFHYKPADAPTLKSYVGSCRVSGPQRARQVQTPDYESGCI